MLSGSETGTLDETLEAGSAGYGSIRYAAFLGIDMTLADILASLLELSIAIAGFSGIVVAIQNRADRTAEETLYLSALLGGAFFSASLSTLGMVLLASPMESLTAWRATSLAHAGCLVAILAFRTYQLRRVAVAPPRSAVIIGVAMLGLALAQVANAAALHQPWICVALLSVYAFFAFGYFVLLLFSLDRRNAA